MTLPICTQCGDEFQPNAGTGRPRTRCRKCSPPRKGLYQPKRKKPGAPAIQSGGQSHDAAGINPVGTATPGIPSPGVHCAWCGAYTVAGTAFCNPAHRALFTQKVADVRNGGESITLSEAKRLNAAREYKRDRTNKRPLQRAREQREALLAKSKIKKIQHGAAR